MSATTINDWRAEFGVEASKPPRFFSGSDDIELTTPQGHLIRRAFDVLKVDGILCADHSPLIYFKLVNQITQQAVYDLHRQFWNHSGAPLLVLITSDRIHVYSGMTKPTPIATSQPDLPSLVTTIDRVADALKEFIVAVESGEFFRRYQRSFDPTHRVDRHLLDNLQNARTKLGSAARKRIPTDVLDALLCRLVFTCYLFDRKVIGENYLADLKIRDARDLRDLLSLSPAAKAKQALYKLFDQLRKDFNGDLFSRDLTDEKEMIQDQHIAVLNRFFQGTDVVTGQAAFWPYDFEFIPIETISAIYERFLKENEEQKGAFYTPRFLAEVVLDTALEGFDSLIGKRFFDPACGSGIFLVGLFNRIAEEWRQANPTARNDRRATELMRLLRESLFGVDISRTACHIAAFSLYLAYLDQLSPPDIQALQRKGKALPQLVAGTGKSSAAGNIRCADFFSDGIEFPNDVSLVVGNPPWGSIATSNSPAGKWCKNQGCPIPDKQIAAAFAWKAARHIAAQGRVCFLLPHGVIFNHSTTAIPFQTAWVKAHEIERVINLADLRFLLFEKAIHPAIAVSYRQYPPRDTKRTIEYWTPKSDWTVTRTEVITISPQDRTTVTVEELLRDLASPDAPQIWKNRHWATPRDWRLLDRLMSLPRLRDIVSQSREKQSPRRWLIAEGFQPLGSNDDEAKAQEISLPSKYFVHASSDAIDLILLPTDCEKLPSNKVTLRSRSNKNTQVFRNPHVLVTKGFKNIAFADFDVSFRHALRGISGPKEDGELLMFLAGYLRTPLAQYFAFHTTSNWGIYRPEVHVEELLRIPFPLPDQTPNPARSREIVKHVAQRVADCAAATRANFLDRANQIRTASAAIESLINEYFDVLQMEAALINDTLNVIVPSIQPTLSRMPVETVKPASDKQCDEYVRRVETMLNGWGKRNGAVVKGRAMRSEALGIGVAVLEKLEKRQKPAKEESDHDILRALDRLRKAIPNKHATLDIVRGVLVFDRGRLYVVKPIGQRFWCQTAAMNDADEIAGTILMRIPKEGA